MSGIAGLVYGDGRPVEAAALEALARAHPHRLEPPETWREGPAGLVRFPLRVTPESLGERQPVVSPSGDVLVFDGRIDNRADLIVRLGGGGSDVPDGALVLAALERFGDEALSLFVGDYAFGWWRPRTRRLFCARSPVGWRPLLWTFDGNRLAFATEPRTLVVGLGLERRLNEGFAAEVMANRITGLTDTLWAGVHRLAPGWALVLEQGQAQTRRWHQGPFEDFGRESMAQHVERFREAFDQALLAAHRSVTPVASQLSGGLDSSSVVCRSAELYRAGRLDRMVHPISVRFPGQACDEGPWIEAVERQTGVMSAHVMPVASELEAMGAWCASTLHLPVRSNALATLAPALDHMQANGMTVLLSGEGGDDWFNGSRAHWPDLVRQGRWLRLLQEGISPPGGTIPGKMLAVAEHALGPLISSAFRKRILLNALNYGAELPDGLSRDWVAKTDLAERLEDTPTPPGGLTMAQQQRFQPYGLGRSDTVFEPVNSYAAARGIEWRHPLHDLRLTTLAMGAAGGLLKTGKLRKHLMRQAMAGCLPEDVRTRVTKAEFSLPLATTLTEWFRRKTPQQVLPVQMGWIVADYLSRVAGEYEAWAQQDAGAPFPQTPVTAVWNILAMDLWLEHALKV